MYEIEIWYELYIFLNFCGDIPGMLVHYFQIILNFLYVRQSVSWHTSLLKLDKCSDISSFGWDIILKFFGNIPEIFVHFFQLRTNFLYVCQSVGWLISLLKLNKYRDISCSSYFLMSSYNYLRLGKGKGWIYCLPPGPLFGGTECKGSLFLMFW